MTLIYRGEENVGSTGSWLSCRAKLDDEIKMDQCAEVDLSCPNT